MSELKQKSSDIVTKDVSHSERFTNEVIKQFTSTAGELQLTNLMRKLCQNYFIKLDQSLKAAEIKRMAKSEQFRDKLEFSWKNVNMQKLAVDVIAFAGVGLDPVQPNHINLIPYKNNATNQYDIVFIPGYRGKEIKARKYGLEVPDDIIVELIYKNDKFKQLKRDLHNRIESYEFQVVDSFDRGEVVGGFYYLVFNNAPEKNKIRVFSKADIDKRKPDSASAEFWGGEKDEWKDGKKTGKKIVVDGWYEEMAYKTIYSAAWNSITIDATKIDDHFRAVLAKEREPIDEKVMIEIRENANLGEPIGFEEVKETAPAALDTAEQATEIVDNTSGPSF